MFSGCTPTAEERQWMDRICQIGCIVCRLTRELFTPCSPHHIEGKTKPGAHKLTIGLCTRHHQVPDNRKPRRWTSRHGDGRAAFESAYMPELDLLEVTRQLVSRLVAAGVVT